VAEIMDVSLETAERYTLGAVSERMRETIATMNSPASQGGVAPRRRGWHVPTPAIGPERKVAENGGKPHMTDPRATVPRLVKGSRSPSKNA